MYLQVEFKLQQLSTNTEELSRVRKRRIKLQGNFFKRTNTGSFSVVKIVKGTMCRSSLSAQ